MCGLLAIIGRNNISAISENVFDEMRYRGPDETRAYFTLGNSVENTYSETCSAMFAFHRLSIRGLDTKYGQPFFIDDQTILLFNGELYNCQELISSIRGVINSESDTYILAQGIKQQGIEFLHKIKGMFSVVVFNMSSGKIYYCRDCFGIKPLYQLFTKDGVLLCSEEHTLKQLKLTLPKQISSHATSLESVKPGNLFSYDIESKHITTTELEGNVTYNRARKDKQGFYCALRKNQFHKVFENTLERLAIFTGKCGLLLSSGVDSNALYIGLSNIGVNFQCYTFDYAEVGVASEYQLIVKHLNRNAVHPVTMDNQKILTNFIEFCDENESIENEFSIAVQKEIYKAMAKDNVRIAFSGQGADEVWLGYEANINFFLQDLIKDNKLKLAKKYLKSYRYYETRPWYKKLDQMIKNHEKRKSYKYRFIRSEFFKLKQQLDYETLHSKAKTRIQSRLGQLLEWEDLNSMRNSIETRLPYLDYQLFEFAMQYQATDLFLDIGTKAPIRKYINQYDTNYKNIPLTKLGYTLQSDIIAKIYFEDANNLKIKQELKLDSWTAQAVSTVNAYKKGFELNN